MNRYDFDTPVDRRGTCAEKWDLFPGAPDAMPMWVADMDFAAPPEVTAAMRERLDHGVYGYTYAPDRSRQIAADWRLKRCGHAVRPEWVTFSAGVVCTMKAAVEAFTDPGDAVVVQTPVYPPFVRIPKHAGRTVVTNPLMETPQGWRMDLDHLEACFKSGARFLMLCSPHNPVGRVWTIDELKELTRLCVRYDVTVVSDEIHCDILAPGVRHTALAALDGMQDRTITCYSATKAFNLAGLQQSAIIVADAAKKRRLEQELYRFNHNTPNLFGWIAQDAAWTRGEAWLEAVNAYLAQNIDLAVAELARQSVLSTRKPEGTYLLWVNCGGLGLTGQALQDFFVQSCRVFPSMGEPFGAADCVRLNLATARCNVAEAMGRILAALH